MDVAAIEPGRDFRKAIDESVSNCSILLAMIGQEWLESKNDTGRRRLENPNDFVRMELASALQRDIPVVPLLVRGAKMPRPDQLPDDLKELAYRNAMELTHARWKTDVQLLIQALRPYMEEELPAAQEKAVAAREPTAPRPALVIAAPMMERIVRELAVFIGPIAEVVVKRAALRAASVEKLCGSVAREIESDADRARFLRACRS